MSMSPRCPHCDAPQTVLLGTPGRCDCQRRPKPVPVTPMRIDVLIPHAELRRIVNDYLVSRGIRISILKIDYDYEYEQLCLDIVGEPLPESAQPTEKGAVTTNEARSLRGWIIS